MALTRADLIHEYEHEFSGLREEQYAELLRLGYPLPNSSRVQKMRKADLYTLLDAIRQMPQDPWDDSYFRNLGREINARPNSPKGRASGFFDEHPGGSIAGISGKQIESRQSKKRRRKAGKRQVQAEMMEMMEPVSMEPITRQKHPAEGALEGVVIYADGGYSPTYYASFDAFFSTPEEAQRYIDFMDPEYVDDAWVEELMDVSRSDEHGGNPTVYGVRTGMKAFANYYGRPMAFASIYREMGQKRTLRVMRGRRGARANTRLRGKRK